MKKDPKTAATRHAGPHPDPIKPPDGLPKPLPKDPCAVAADRAEQELNVLCAGKFNEMLKGCCCELDPADRDLPHIDSADDAALLNTASDQAGGVIPIYSNDHFWEVATSIAGPWAPAVVCDEIVPPWMPGPVGGADWISIEGDARPGPDGGEPGDYFFRLRFVLCEGIDPAKFVLTANALADDVIMGVYVNGLGVIGSPSGNDVDYDKPVTIEIAQNWQPCVNELIFHVSSRMTWLGFLASFTIADLPIEPPCDECECKPLELPGVAPCFTVHWGDSACDCFETNDLETICITACNCYSNVTFEGLTIYGLTIVDALGNPVANLPDGMPSVEVLPAGPICFDDLGPCKPGEKNCKSRQFLIRTCGAIAGKYTLKFDHVCFRICYSGSTDACFDFELCKD